MAKVELALREGRMTIVGFDIANPPGFSPQSAFKIDSMMLDLGDIISEPYVIQTINISAPSILYELNASGDANLFALQKNLMANLPKTDDTPTSSDESKKNPLLVVENIVLSGVRIK